MSAIDIMEDTAFGCVLFDDAHEHASGYSSVSGDSRPSRISGTADLSSDTYWLTNLNYNIARNSGLRGNARFRDEGFLTGNIGSIPQMLGFREDAILGGIPQITDYIRDNKLGSSVSTGDLPYISTKIIANVFRNVVRLSSHILGVSSIDNYKFNRTIREAAFQPDPLMDKYIVDAVTDSIAYNIEVERNVGQNEQSESRMLLRASLSPIDHAITMLSLPVPAGVFKTYSRSADIKKILNQTDRPFLAKCVVDGTLPEFNRIVNYGAGRLSTQKGQRRWMSSVELEFMKHVSNVDVREVIVAEYSLEYPWVKDVRNLLIELKSKLDLSVSGHLFAHNLWTAMGVSKSPSATSSRGSNKYINMLAPFLYSMDRQYCMMKVVELIARGHDVRMYGGNKIFMSIDQTTDRDLLVNDCMDLGLIPPVIFPDSPNQKTSTPYEIMQSLFAKGDVAKILSLDDRVVSAIEKL